MLVGESVIAVLLFFCGFRLSYNPQLENSWDAISACASWVGVIASTVAIFVAIRIPQKIAEQQNKIALYEKRFAVYDVLCKCSAFAQAIRNESTGKDIPMYFIAAFSREVISDDSGNVWYRTTLALLCDIAVVLQGAEFLFGFDSKETKMLNQLSSSLTNITDVIKHPEHYKQRYTAYTNAVHAVEETIFPIVKETLELEQVDNNSGKIVKVAKHGIIWFWEKEK